MILMLVSYSPVHFSVILDPYNFFFKLTIILASQYTPLSSQHISSNINISLSRFLHTNLFHFSLIPVPRAKVMVNFERREYKETEKNSRGSELVRKLDQIKVGQMPAV
jgi:hypothetical protein